MHAVTELFVKSLTNEPVPLELLHTEKISTVVVRGSNFIVEKEVGRTRRQQKINL